MKFQSTRLMMNLLAPSDRKDFFRLYRSPKVMQYIASHLADNKIESMLTNALKLNSINPGKQAIWGIWEKNTNDFVGILMAKSHTYNQSDCEIGIMLTEKKQGKHYSTEALASLIHFLQTEQQVTAFHANVYHENIAAMQMLKALGFSEHGQQKANHITFLKDPSAFNLHKKEGVKFE